MSGTVKDGKGHPIRGASITIKDSYDGATADSLGNFHFQASDKGNYTLIITNIGYNSVEQPVTLNGNRHHPPHRTQRTAQRAKGRDDHRRLLHRR